MLFESRLHDLQHGAANREWYLQGFELVGTENVKYCIPLSLSREKRTIQFIKVMQYNCFFFLNQGMIVTGLSSEMKLKELCFHLESKKTVVVFMVGQGHYMARIEDNHFFQEKNEISRIICPNS